MTRVPRIYKRERVVYALSDLGEMDKQKGMYLIPLKAKKQRQKSLRRLKIEV